VLPVAKARWFERIARLRAGKTSRFGLGCRRSRRSFLNFLSEIAAKRCGPGRRLCSTTPIRHETAKPRHSICFGGFADRGLLRLADAAGSPRVQRHIACSRDRMRRCTRDLLRCGDQAQQQAEGLVIWPRRGRCCRRCGEERHDVRREEGRERGDVCGEWWKGRLVGADHDASGWVVCRRN
jgi:hypothetical protein